MWSPSVWLLIAYPRALYTPAPRCVTLILQPRARARMCVCACVTAPVELHRRSRPGETLKKEWGDDIALGPVRNVSFFLLAPAGLLKTDCAAAARGRIANNWVLFVWFLRLLFLDFGCWENNGDAVCHALLWIWRIFVCLRGLFVVWCEKLKSILFLAGTMMAFRT